jgi:Tfp pilus assembly protein PilF
VSLALVLRLVHLVVMQYSPFGDVLLGDAERYDAWAQRIAAGDVLGTAVFYQAPLYPYLLGAVYAVLGHHVMVIRVLQAVFGSLACGLVFWASYRAFGALAAIAAGLILAIYGPGLFFDSLIQKSSLDGILVACLLFTIVGSSKLTSPYQPFAIGVVIGLLALNRENALVLLPLAALWFGVITRRVGVIALLLAGAAIVLAPAVFRNRIVGGEWVLTSSQAGPNLFIGNNASASGTYEPLVPGHGSVEFEQSDSRRLAEDSTRRRLSASEVSAYWRARALAWITENPQDAALLTGRKTALLLNRREAADTEDIDSHSQYSWLLTICDSLLNFGVLAPLAALGMFLTRRQSQAVSLICLLVAGYAASVLAFYVLDRYRYPLVPFLAFFAGAGIAKVAERWRSGERRELVPALTIAVAMALVCNWPLPILASERQRAVTALNLGNVLERSGRDPEALAEYQRAIALLPSFGEAHGHLASVLRRRGSIDEAMKEFDEAIKLEPSVAEIRSNYGMLLAESGRLDEAISQMKIAVRLDEQSAESHYNLATAYASTGQLGAAEAEYLTTIRLNPQKADAHNNLGSVLASQGRIEDAIGHFKEAVRLQPQLEGARANLDRAERLRRH